jgi:hypothetical protein
MVSCSYKVNMIGHKNWVTLKSVPWLSAKPTGIVCHDVETSRQRALGLGFGSFALVGPKYHLVGSSR